MKHFHLPVSFFLSFCSIVFAYNEDSSRVFYSNVELSIQQDYWLCTGDSIRLSRADLIKWKTGIDSITDSENFKMLVRSFSEETGLNPSDARPCEIIAWKKNRDKQKQEHDLIYKESERIHSQKKADSLFIIEELNGKVSRPFDFHEIPFGVSKRCVQLLGELKKIPFTETDDYLQIDSVYIDGQKLRAAFFFDQNQKYCRYELESLSGPLDSLDWWIRPRADSIRTYFQKRIGSAPDHSYRTGRFDIVQGRLAITDLWNLKDASVYVGLATYKYRYYGKAVVVYRKN
ncbi:MAG: hypothetical protein GX640_00740 [Fibrobacter sp.]|nr:hypothetical protein [Fibrobacter sp.]